MYKYCTFVSTLAHMNLAGQLHHKVFSIIASVAEQEEVQVFVIGGFVRDLLL